jgi:ubiquinone/menaquinone biosynthesis C-methylase UbiE
MPLLFWTGRLSPSMKLLVNMSNALAWVTGNARDTTTMKQRMKQGYDGVHTDHVTRYDELGFNHYNKIAQLLLEGLELQDKEVLDVGCGTGILSFAVLQKNAKKVTCGDMSEYMLEHCRAKAAAHGYDQSRVIPRQLDAESLPFSDGSFDSVVSGMVLGLVPDQTKMVCEMTRVLRNGGVLAIATHGPDYYYEANDAAFRVIPKRYVLGYRIEFWPRQEESIKQMLLQAGLTGVQTKRLTWQDDFKDGSDVYDFFAATSAAWWTAKFPAGKVSEISDKIRNYFKQRHVTRLTQDVIIACGQKSVSG